MISRLASTTAVLLTASSLVAAQTSTICDPTKKSCPADPAVGGTKTIDFTKGESNFFTSASGSNVTYDPTLGAAFIINADKEAPTFTSKDYIFFGKVDVTVRASHGTGIVTSFVLQSDDLDEIDWEWLGGDTTQVQTNYFSKGNTTTFDRGGFSGVSTPQADFHTYTIDWNSERLNWEIDGTVVRTLNYADANNGATYPQSPMQIKLGTWCAGGPDEPSGTVEWAGGYTNFKQAPFIGYYQKLVIQDYSNGVSGAKQYVYGDHSGTYKSIKVETTGGSDESSGSGTQSAATTLSTAVATSTAGNVPSAASEITLATGAASAGGAGGSTSSTSSSKSASSVATTSAGNKSIVNFALLGAALLAFTSL